MGCMKEAMGMGCMKKDMSAWWGTCDINELQTGLLCRGYIKISEVSMEKNKASGSAFSFEKVSGQEVFLYRYFFCA